MTYRFLIPASEELDEAIAYYERQQKDLGFRFLVEVQRGISQIVRWPSAWQKVSRRARQYRVKRFPYGIVYEVGADEIVIVAIANLHRRFGYWKGRT